MTRYTINIGDDFPLDGPEDHRHGPDHGPGHRRLRGAGLLKVLFFIALAVIVISHPVQTALLIGALFLLRRSRWVHEMKHRIGREGYRWPELVRREIRDWRERHHNHQAHQGPRGGRGRRDRQDDTDLGEFV